MWKGITYSQALMRVDGVRHLGTKAKRALNERSSAMRMAPDGQSSEILRKKMERSGGFLSGHVSMHESLKEKIRQKSIEEVSTARLSLPWSSVKRAMEVGASGVTEWGWSLTGPQQPLRY